MKIVATLPQLAKINTIMFLFNEHEIAIDIMKP